MRNCSVWSTTGAISGYAWSNTLGWISFNETIGCPPAAACGAYVQGVSPGNMTGYKAVKGWAKALAGGTAAAGGWGGWIRLDHNQANPVSYSFEDKIFKGFAWGGPLVLGWISFNSTDTSSAVAYSVKGPGTDTDTLVPLGPLETAPDCDSGDDAYLKISALTNGNNGLGVTYALYPISAGGVVGPQMTGSYYFTGAAQRIVFKDYSATTTTSKRYAIYARIVSTGESVSTATSSLISMDAGFSCGADPNDGSAFINTQFGLSPDTVFPPAQCGGRWSVSHNGDPDEVTPTCFITSNKDAPVPVIIPTGTGPFGVGTHTLSCELRNATEPDIVYDTVSIARRCLRNAELIER